MRHHYKFLIMRKKIRKKMNLKRSGKSHLSTDKLKSKMNLIVNLSEQKEAVDTPHFPYIGNKNDVRQFQDNGNTTQKDHGKKIFEEKNLIEPNNHNEMNFNRNSPNEENHCQSLSSDLDKNDEKPKKFDELGVCEELVVACKSVGWIYATEIQKEVIPYGLARRDIIGIAETGSGKTGAFIIPILQNLLKDMIRLYALILSPTRELSIQINDHILSIGSFISVETCILLGGLDFSLQALQLSKKPHIIISTPGRLIDHLQNTKGFTLSTLQYLVLDEADRLLSMDFEQHLLQLIKVIPKRRTTFLFSATMTSKVSKLQRVSLNKPVKIEVNSKYSTAKNLVQKFCLIPYKYKFNYLVAIMMHYDNHTVMIFSNTCLQAKKVAIFLRQLGFSSISLNGKMTQPQRIGALNVFRSGRRNILVATEVGSRGLDIPAVEVVINFDIPLNSKDYIHRVGRTARAGKSGVAISIVTQYDVEAFQKIEYAIGKKLEEFNDIREESVMQLNERTLEALRLVDMEIKDCEGNLFKKRMKGKKSRKL